MGIRPRLSSWMRSAVGALTRKLASRRSKPSDGISFCRLSRAVCRKFSGISHEIGGAPSGVSIRGMIAGSGASGDSPGALLRDPWAPAPQRMQ
ncbi:MAG: hypothetical protein CVU65_12340 [Deltaproteobacteria bacterium HGW-Deltaproteobacteria-22]|nr:MAG: hypothetical protein CVU65_12340 [Deltaproteobacteria bacterium HGW-Deltaproteobacteria-22]